MHRPVTAVVSAFNEEAVIGQCLTALCQSRYHELVEIIVVDDGSTDNTAGVVEAMARRDRRIRLLRQPNRGKPHGLNRAFVEAQTDVVVTLDADTRVHAAHRRPAGAEGSRPIGAGGWVRSRVT